MLRPSGNHLRQSLLWLSGAKTAAPHCSKIWIEMVIFAFPWTSLTQFPAMKTSSMTLPPYPPTTVIAVTMRSLPQITKSQLVAPLRSQIWIQMIMIAFLRRSLIEPCTTHHMTTAALGALLNTSPASPLRTVIAVPIACPVQISKPHSQSPPAAGPPAALHCLPSIHLKAPIEIMIIASMRQSGKQQSPLIRHRATSVTWPAFPLMTGIALMRFLEQILKRGFLQPAVRTPFLVLRQGVA